MSYIVITCAGCQQEHRHELTGTGEGNWQQDITLPPEWRRVRDGASSMAYCSRDCYIRHGY